MQEKRLLRDLNDGDKFTLSNCEHILRIKRKNHYKDYLLQDCYFVVNEYGDIYLFNKDTEVLVEVNIVPFSSLRYGERFKCKNSSNIYIKVNVIDSTKCYGMVDGDFGLIYHINDMYVYPIKNL